MKTRPLAALLFLAGITPLLAQDADNGLEVKPDEQCVAANMLPGTWRADAALTKRLGGPSLGEEIDFRADATVLAGVPKAIAAKLREMRIYLAGTMTLRGAGHPFLLTVLSGNPTVVWFRERDGNPMGDAESMNVMLVRGETRTGDLLFVGGDFDNQPFSAFGRKTATVALTPAAVITDMIRLLESDKALELMETYMSPKDRARFTERGRSLEEMAKAFSEDKPKRLLEALRIVVKLEPTMSDDGDTATWDTDVEGLDRAIRLQRIDGRWYVMD